MTIAPSSAEVEARLHRVQEHIDELRRNGRNEDAEAVSFVRDLAERVLARRRSQPRELLTTGQAALSLGISGKTVRNWVAAGRLSAVKRGVRTMIPRQAVIDEIDRSRARVQEESASETVGAGWRRELLATLPRGTVERLGDLHEKMEDGRALSPDEQVEMVRLERDMMDSAARHLERVVNRVGDA